MDFKNTISRQNIEVVQRLLQNGIWFEIATGKNYKEVKTYIERFDYSIPIISLNGERVQDEKREIISLFFYYKFEWCKWISDCNK
ncbi:HAD hydrolase family protein [Carnobacterium sp.]|uniref:HAD family hydrolase n=1 Tax=Carnobacterium sp. TaxID=48221 RepID=UPI0028A751E6|nr:HAD hydrolase family protein [Carnobacterium sp.]